jgi:NAD(P)-dependent dehydrogenase (short-subunit alcohol dehydrogenase family)
MQRKRQVVLVTGASSGMGKAVATVLSGCGHVVYGTGRFSKEIMTPEGYRMLPMDVRHEDQVQSVLQKIVSEQGRIDAVVNNAGLGLLGSVENITNEEVKAIMETNVHGVLNVCRNAIPLLREASGGTIINITSLAGLIGLPFRGIYSASKFAVEGFTESMSQEVQQFGIRVCIVEPGDFKTNINSSRMLATNVTGHYRRQHDETLRRVNEEVSSARDPEIVGHLVQQILLSSSPKLRYKIATPSQHMAIFLKRILPGRWFEKIVMKFYGMK